MTENKQVQDQVLTPPFRVSFPSVFEPTSYDNNPKKEYCVTMLFEKGTDLKELRALVLNTAIAKWGADRKKWPKHPELKLGYKLPFRDGAEKDQDGYGEGVIFCVAKSKHKPGVSDQQVKPIIEPSEFYAGCYARATVTAYAWKYMGKEGISLGLRNIQKVKDGEPFSGKNKPENDFDAIDTPAGDEGMDEGSAAGTEGTGVGEATDALGI